MHEEAETQDQPEAQDVVASGATDTAQESAITLDANILVEVLNQRLQASEREVLIQTTRAIQAERALAEERKARLTQQADHLATLARIERGVDALAATGTQIADVAQFGNMVPDR